jgi:hypothetical protein
LYEILQVNQCEENKGSRARISLSEKLTGGAGYATYKPYFCVVGWRSALIATVAGAGERVAVLDECDPATFNALPPVGPGLVTICDVKFDGEVTFAEFLSLLPPGHPAWRNEPSWLEIKSGRKVKATNE